MGGIPLGLLELILVAGIVLGLAVFELARLRRERRRSRDRGAEYPS